MYFPIIDVLKENFIAKIPSIVTQWLTDNVDPVGSAVVVDESLSISGAAADAKITGDEISDLKSDLIPLVGESNEYIAHWDETFTGNIAENVYKSSTITIPSGSTINKFRFYARYGSESPQGYLFILDSSDTIKHKVAFASTQVGWQEVDVNITVDEDSYIALTGASVALTYSTQEKVNYYSNGFYEAQQAERDKGVGETITFSHVVEGRYYEFGFEIFYGTKGRVDVIEEQLSVTDSEIDASSFVMPLVVKKDGTFTLIGRWFDHRLDDTRFKNCCNCGGQSIMFKVKGATTINANFGQVSRYPDNEDFLMVNEPYMAYSIDGSAFTRVQLDTTNGNTIAIADTNEHFVWIVIDGMDMVTKNGTNRDTGWIGVYIKSITTDGTMYAVEPKNKQILFVGDSMVEGINTLGTDSKAPSNSAVNEFSFKTAQKLNSIPLLNGYGGTTTWGGVNWVRYSFGTTDSNVTTMEPDLIVIEYGHNDNTLINNATHTVEEFVAEYEELIAILRGMYTGTPIICIVPFHQYLASAVAEVVENTECCYLVETADYGATYSDGTHPNASGATIIAERLSSDIIDIMGKEYFV